MKRFLLLKLNALITLARHLGMLGRARSKKLAFDPEIAVMAAIVIVSDKAGDVQKAAAGVLLDIYVPGWRSRHKELAGYVAQRNDAEAAAWRRAVINRDGVCQQCGAQDHLEAHHIVQWSIAPNLRLLLENGITLCQPCHKKVPVLRN